MNWRIQIWVFSHVTTEEWNICRANRDLCLSLDAVIKSSSTSKENPLKQCLWCSGTIISTLLFKIVWALNIIAINIISFMSSFVSCILLFYIVITNQKLSGFSCIGVFIQRHNRFWAAEEHKNGINRAITVTKKKGCTGNKRRGSANSNPFRCWEWSGSILCLHVI